MLNYNVNYIEPFGRRNRNFLLGEVDYRWARTITTAAGIQSGSIIFATGSIEYVPYAPSTLFVSGTYDEQKIGSGSAVGQPVTIAITGSGVWPITGSNTFSIVIGGNLGFNQSKILSLSAAAGNMNLSGSKISASFSPEGNQAYSIDFGVNHTKGNIYNPLVKWKTQNISPVTTTGNVNGYTSSFNIVKDVNVPLVNLQQVTGSTSSTFEYLYNFGVTSSLTASVNNVTGSTTMSFSIPEAGLSVTKEFFNPTTTTAIATGSFVATSDATYNLTASVEFNKGNSSNSDINWKVSSSSETEDLEGNQTNINGVSSSFQLKKDIAVMVNYSEITSSISGSYPNDYSFNQTASITSNVNNTTGSVTMSIIVPEAGINIEQRFFNETISTATLTASFEAYGQAPFNVTASIVNNKGNVSNSNINWNVTSSKINNSASLASSFGIRKNGNVQILNVNNALIATASSFKNDYAFNITSSLTSSYSAYYTPGSSSFYFAKSTLTIPEVGINVVSYGTSSIITGSFAAVTGIDNYNISATMVEQATETIEYVLIGGGGAGAPSSGQNPGAGGGAGALLTGSALIISNTPYTVTIGKGGINSTNGSDSIFAGQLVPYDGTWASGVEINNSYLIAPGGGVGGLVNTLSTSGGSGGGGGGFGVDQLSQPPSAGTTTGSLAVSASMLIIPAMTASFLNIDAAGSSGSAGVLLPRQGFPGFSYGAGGNGGGKPTNISWLDGIINSGNVAGGGGGGNQWAQGSYQTTPGFGGGNGQSSLGVVGNAVQYTGGGGGGAATYSGTPPGFASIAGYGASGSMNIRYPGLQNGTGGTIQYIDGYTIHTFTSSGEFTIFSNTEPIIPTTASFNIQYAIVGGGGAGATATGGGGGAAGQLLSGSINNVNLTGSFNGIFNITVGDGGLTVDTNNFGGNSGSISFLSSSNHNFIAFGGAGGAGITNNFTSSISASGGGGCGAATASLIGGTGFTNGGNAFYGTGSIPNTYMYAGGGGGGYSQNGQNASGSYISDAGYWTGNAGNGANGIQLFITSSAPYVAAGGGGGVRNNVQTTGNNGLGGSGIGGDGAKFVGFQTRLSATSGKRNTGSGGGGGAEVSPEGQSFGVRSGGNGGSGVVYLRFPNTINLPLFTGNPPVISFDGDSIVYTFITGSTQIQFV